MFAIQQYKGEVVNNGFALINDVYTANEVAAIIKALSALQGDNSNFRKTADLFAIRQFFKEVPAIIPLVFNDTLKQLVNELFGPDYFVVKSIYFDKPGNSNWFVAYHQDLTIAVTNRAEIPGYGPWTVKGDQFGVQPPVEVLQDNFTIRIHLDDTNEDNGALKVISASHKKGIYRAENIDLSIDDEEICRVKAGGVMLMKPLLMHASNRTTNEQNRRVIHIEFSRVALPDGIDWAERFSIG